MGEHSTEMASGWKKGPCLRAWDPMGWGNGNVINGRARARVGANHWLLEGSRFARVRSQRRKPHDRDQMASVHDLCLARDQRPAQADCLFEAAICDPVPENVGGRENGTTGAGGLSL